MQHYLVIDLEATCSDDHSVPRDQMEIIEIGAVMVDSATLQPLDEFQAFVRPVRTPLLTEFCVELTGITQAKVDAAPKFPDVLHDLVAWANAFNEYVFCSWGAYDRSQLKQDCDHHGVDYPLGAQHINLKAEFAEITGRRPMGVIGALRRVGLTFSGSHHRGIDDARNICRLLPSIFPPANG